MDNDKLIKYLRDLEKLKASGIKSEDYTSALEKDVNVAKGSGVIKEPVTRIKGMTEHIDTKSGNKLSSGEEFKNKIASVRKGGGKGKLGMLLGLAGAAASNFIPADSYASDLIGKAQDAADEADPMVQAQKVYENVAPVEDIIARAKSTEKDEKSKNPMFSKLMKMMKEK